jgi:hypothetical protein
VQQPLIVPDNLESIMTTYRRLWPLMPALHMTIGKLADKAAIRACAKRLGMLAKQDGKQTVKFDHELEMDIFQDYLIYMHRPRGLSLTQQMRNRNRYPQGSDERRLLAAMAQARFSIFWIKEIVPPGGFIALDIISGQDFFILDPMQSPQDITGTLAGVRIFPHQNVWMHTGATLSLGRIDDPAGLQTLGNSMNVQQERELNEEAIGRWRGILKQTPEK